MFQFHLNSTHFAAPSVSAVRMPLHFPPLSPALSTLVYEHQQLCCQAEGKVSFPKLSNVWREGQCDW